LVGLTLKPEVAAVVFFHFLNRFVLLVEHRLKLLVLRHYKHPAVVVAPPLENRPFGQAQLPPLFFDARRKLPGTRDCRGTAVVHEGGDLRQTDTAAVWNLIFVSASLLQHLGKKFGFALSLSPGWFRHSQPYQRRSLKAAAHTPTTIAPLLP